MHLESDSNEQQINPFASALEPVWEKVRTAAALMASLRQEKSHLEERIAGLEEEVRRNNDVLSRQGAELAHLKSQVDALDAVPPAPAPAPSVIAIGSDERVQLQQKIKTALSKLDTYLSAS